MSSGPRSTAQPESFLLMEEGFLPPHLKCRLQMFTQLKVKIVGVEVGLGTSHPGLFWDISKRSSNGSEQSRDNNNYPTLLSLDALPETS